MDMINEAERKALTDAIVDHMLAMKQNVWDCVKIIDKILSNVEQTSNKIGEGDIDADRTFGFFENDNETYKSRLDCLLNYDISPELFQPIEELSKHLFTGIKFYNRLLKSNFYLISDLPIMLTVDRKINAIICHCIMLNYHYPKYFSEKYRHIRSKYEKNKRSEPVLDEISRIINTISTDNGNELYTIQGLSEEVHRRYQRRDRPSIRTINTKIRKLFAGKISGTAGEKYLPSDLTK